MRTNIDIDDKIMQEAMRSGGFKTKKTVEAALKMLSKRLVFYQKILALCGKVDFDPAYDHKNMRQRRKGNSG